MDEDNGGARVLVYLAAMPYHLANVLARVLVSTVRLRKSVDDEQINPPELLNGLDERAHVIDLHQIGGVGDDARKAGEHPVARPVCHHAIAKASSALGR